MRKFNVTSLLKYAAMLTLAALVAVSCKDDDDDTPPSLVEDGVYLTGEATDYSALNLKSMMEKGYNEADNGALVNGLWEKYVALEAGKTFTITKVSGATRTVYGSDALETVDLAGASEQPNASVLTGVYAANKTFTVTTSGLYHITIYEADSKIWILPVNWGLIGGATALGWGGDTPLTSSAFSKTEMTFSGENIVLRVGNYKIRNSGGWKLWISEDGSIKVNTNYGYRIDSLVRGGSDMENAVAGIYTYTVKWNSQNGTTATAVKTDDLPMTNWTGVELDMIGTGVSPDNPTAVVSTTWGNWGYTILADNNAQPTVNGTVYTWTFNGVILEASEGFKVRTKDGTAPPVNGANFDAGYAQVDLTASTSMIGDGGDNNMTVSTKGAFNVVITIDASNDDAKSIVITEAK